MIASIFWLLVFGGVVIMRMRGGRWATVTLLEYQRGVLYRHGLPERDLGPGRYRVWTKVSKAILVDTRPIQVSYQNQAVILRDGWPAVYDVSGTARVVDARRAIYSAGNYGQVPAYVLLCCARLALNGTSSAQVRADKDALAETIVGIAKPRLQALGFELLSFRLPQCALAMTGPKSVE
jgi:regulator of protease activity HflC (stomatin/prohibitin superfamily)